MLFTKNAHKTVKLEIQRWKIYFVQMLAHKTQSAWAINRIQEFLQAAERLSSLEGH